MDIVVAFQNIHSCYCNILVGTDEQKLMLESDVKIAVIIVMNLLMMIHSCCVDLDEQWQSIDELDELYSMEIKKLSLISRSILCVVDALIHKHYRNQSHHHKNYKIIWDSNLKNNSYNLEHHTNIGTKDT